MVNSNDHVLAYVDAYLHDALESRDRETVDKHLATCPICQVALDEARKRSDAVSSLPPLEASNDLLKKTEERIDQYEKQPRLVKAYRRFKSLPLPAKATIVATLAAVCIASVHLYYATLQPTPYDLRVLGQTELLAGSRASVRVVVMNRNTGVPLAGVPVLVQLLDPESSQTVELATFHTDDRGTGSPRFTLPDWKDGRYQLQIVAKPDGEREEITRDVQLRREWRLMLSTDKPLYQPGQTVRIRSLALRRPDLKPVTGREVQFSITDPKGNVIFRKRDVTSRFGIASTGCPLATELLLGNYQVECRIGNTASKATVAVKRYVLPKFNVAVELDRPYYQPRAVVRGKINAKYFFGKPVAGAKVVIDVLRSGFNAGSITQFQRQTDENGTASFLMRLPEWLAGRPQRQGDAEVRFRVTVTDKAGQSHTRFVTRRVTAEPIRVEVIAENGRLVRGVNNRVYVLTTYPDGRPAKTRITVGGIEKEYESDPLGVAVVHITPKGEGEEIPLLVKAVDQKGETGRRNVTLRLGETANDFLLRPNRSVLNGGETLELTILGGGSEPVFIDLIKDGQTVVTQTFPIEDGRGQFAFDLPPDLFGTLQLSAYRFNADGIPVQKTRVIYVRPAYRLKVVAKLDRESYRPGRKAKLNLHLLDSQGRPTAGAISLAAVDAAVFSVRQQRPGMEQTFFTLQQELLKPVYAVYSWSPDGPAVDAPNDRRRLEEAIFARTTQSDSDRVATPSWPGRSSDRMHSLQGESFPQKVIDTDATRETGLELAAYLWIGLGIVFAAVIYAWLWYLNSAMAAAVTVVGLFIMFAMFTFPAVQSARQAARESGDKVGYFEGSAKTTAARERRYKTKAEPPHHAKTRKTKRPRKIVSKPPARKSAPQPRVREWFPETLYWRPEVVTDDRGRASVEIDLADSITTWKLSASAVSGDGRLGALQSDVRVFQPFFVDLNLPVNLTRGDEVAVPVVVYNYLDQPQTVRLSLQKSPWFESLETVEQTVELPAGDIRSLHFRIRVRKVGKHALQVTAKAGDVADALRKEIDVVPDGWRIDRVVNGTLSQPADVDINIPANAIEGSEKAFVKIYPTSFSQLVEGLDGVFRRPYGCFEQTSSTTYPNVLALQYLRRANKSVPAVEAKARQYIHLGYQRLLTFEVRGGGFGWFGRSADQTLTAYGLMEFEDMSRVYDVDPKLIDRTRKWLLRRRQANGSWPAQRGDALTTTAYIAWAVFRHGGRSNSDGSSEYARAAVQRYLLQHGPETIDDPYTLALVCNALLVMDGDGSTARPYLDRLLSLRTAGQAGKTTFWQAGGNRRTLFHGGGSSRRIETTALATLALLQADREPAVVRNALTWLVRQRDNNGTWHSTQATVLALKALIEGSGQPLGGNKPRRIDVAVDGRKVQSLVIPPENADVMQQIDLSSQITGGSHRVTLTDRAGNAPGYQVAFRYHVPFDDAKHRPTNEPLSIAVNYDKTELATNETVTAVATVVNTQDRVAPMVMLDLPIPPGFVAERGSFDNAVKAGHIERYEFTARSVIVYLRQLEPNRPLVLRYVLRATTPVKAASAAPLAYEYYNPSRRGTAAPQQFVVRQAGGTQ